MQTNYSDQKECLNAADDFLTKRNYQAAFDLIDDNWNLDDTKELNVIRIRALIGLNKFVAVRRAILSHDVIRKDIEIREQLVKEYKHAVDQHGITDNFVWNFDDFAYIHGINDDPIALAALEKANALFNDKKWQDACVHYSVAIERNLRTSEIYFKRGTSFHELKQYAKAKEDAGNGMGENCDNTYHTQCKFLEIRSAITTGNVGVARFSILYNEAIRSDQTLREQLILEYKTKLAELNVDDETDWSQTEKGSFGDSWIEDHFDQNHLKQADVQFQQQNWSDAIFFYNQAIANMIQHYPNPNHIYLKRGQCYFALGDFQSAYYDFVSSDAHGMKIRTMIALKMYEESYSAITDFVERGEETISRSELAEEWEKALAHVVLVDMKTQNTFFFYFVNI